MKQIIISALQYALLNGGITFNSKGIFSESKGYMVSIIGMENRVEDLTLETVERYVESKLGIINTTSNLYIGIWKDGNEWCLDVSAHIIDKESALRIGINGDQKAIYDVVAEQVIHLPSPQKSGTMTQQQTYLNMKVRELM